MPKLSETVDIGAHIVKVTELTVKQIHELWNELSAMSSLGDASMAAVPGPFTPKVRALWDATITGIKPEELEDYTPSELKPIYEAFERVNASFFDLATRAVEVNPMLKALGWIVVSDLIKRFAGLSNMDTQESSTTDTPSS
ncbi:MAG: hypothetical protein CSYNP_01586 [Syntrophus sp. SKADARSKE-3]|nr:hypothetical protein [Syntrophus sp. SKADARSKE-3]